MSFMTGFVKSIAQKEQEKIKVMQEINNKQSGLMSAIQKELGRKDNAEQIQKSNEFKNKELDLRQKDFMLNLEKFDSEEANNKIKMQMEQAQRMQLAQNVRPLNAVLSDNIMIGNKDASKKGLELLIKQKLKQTSLIDKVNSIMANGSQEEIVMAKTDPNTAYKAMQERIVTGTRGRENAKYRKKDKVTPPDSPEEIQRYQVQTDILKNKFFFLSEAKAKGMDAESIYNAQKSFINSYSKATPAVQKNMDKIMIAMGRIDSKVKLPNKKLTSPITGETFKPHNTSIPFTNNVTKLDADTQKDVLSPKVLIKDNNKNVIAVDSITPYKRKLNSPQGKAYADIITGTVKTVLQEYNRIKDKSPDNIEKFFNEISKMKSMQLLSLPSTLYEDNGMLNVVQQSKKVLLDGIRKSFASTNGILKYKDPATGEDKRIDLKARLRNVLSQGYLNTPDKIKSITESARKTNFQRTQPITTIAWNIMKDIPGGSAVKNVLKLLDLPTSTQELGQKLDANLMIRQDGVRSMIEGVKEGQGSKVFYGLVESIFGVPVAHNTTDFKKLEKDLERFKGGYTSGALGSGVANLGRTIPMVAEALAVGADNVQRSIYTLIDKEKAENDPTWASGMVDEFHSWKESIDAWSAEVDLGKRDEGDMLHDILQGAPMVGAGMGLMTLGATASTVPFALGVSKQALMYPMLFSGMMSFSAAEKLLEDENVDDNIKYGYATLQSSFDMAISPLSLLLSGKAFNSGVLKGLMVDTVGNMFETGVSSSFAKLLDDTTSERKYDINEYTEIASTAMAQTLLTQAGILTAHITLASRQKMAATKTEDTPTTKTPDGNGEVKTPVVSDIDAEMARLKQDVKDNPLTPEQLSRMDTEYTDLKKKLKTENEKTVSETPKPKHNISTIDKQEALKTLSKLRHEVHTEQTLDNFITTVQKLIGDESGGGPIDGIPNAVVAIGRGLRVLTDNVSNGDMAQYIKSLTEKGQSGASRLARFMLLEEGTGSDIASRVNEEWFGKVPKWGNTIHDIHNRFKAQVATAPEIARKRVEDTLGALSLTQKSKNKVHLALLAHHEDGNGKFLPGTSDKLWSSFTDKNGKVHEVPISVGALSIFDSMPITPEEMGNPHNIITLWGKKQYEESSAILQDAYDLAVSNTVVNVGTETGALPGFKIKLDELYDYVERNQKDSTGKRYQRFSPDEANKLYDLLNTQERHAFDIIRGKEKIEGLSSRKEIADKMGIGGQAKALTEIFFTAGNAAKKQGNDSLAAFNYQLSALYKVIGAEPTEGYLPMNVHKGLGQTTGQQAKSFLSRLPRWKEFKNKVTGKGKLFNSKMDRKTKIKLAAKSLRRTSPLDEVGRIDLDDALTGMYMNEHLYLSMTDAENLMRNMVIPHNEMVAFTSKGKKAGITIDDLPVPTPENPNPIVKVRSGNEEHRYIGVRDTKNEIYYIHENDFDIIHPALKNSILRKEPSSKFGDALDFLTNNYSLNTLLKPGSMYRDIAWNAFRMVTEGLPHEAIRRYHEYSDNGVKKSVREVGKEMLQDIVRTLKNPEERKMAMQMERILSDSIDSFARMDMNKGTNNQRAVSALSNIGWWIRSMTDTLPKASMGSLILDGHLRPQWERVKASGINIPYERFRKIKMQAMWEDYTGASQRARAMAVADPAVKKTMLDNIKANKKMSAEQIEMLVRDNIEVINKASKAMHDILPDYRQGTPFAKTLKKKISIPDLGIGRAAILKGVGLFATFSNNLMARNIRMMKAIADPKVPGYKKMQYALSIALIGRGIKQAYDFSMGDKKAREGVYDIDTLTRLLAQGAAGFKKLATEGDPYSLITAVLFPVATAPGIMSSFLKATQNQNDYSSKSFGKTIYKSAYPVIPSLIHWVPSFSKDKKDNKQKGEEVSKYSNILNKSLEDVK